MEGANGARQRLRARGQMTMFVIVFFIMAEGQESGIVAGGRGQCAESSLLAEAQRLVGWVKAPPIWLNGHPG